MILCPAKMPQPEEEGASDPCFLLADEGRREDAMCAMPVCNDGADQAPTPLGARVGVASLLSECHSFARQRTFLVVFPQVPSHYLCGEREAGRGIKSDLEEEEGREEG